jgi:hypothetical protein
MIDLELLKTYAIDLLSEKVENGVDLETLGEYTRTITNFILYVDDLYVGETDDENKFFHQRELKPLAMNYFSSCLIKCTDNAEKLGKITEIITDYIKFILKALEEEGKFSYE